MSDCPACAVARVRTSCEYANGCAGCTARSIARSLTAWHALHAKGSGDRKPLTEMVNRLLGRLDPKEARRLVLEWWRRDHPEGTA